MYEVDFNSLRTEIRLRLENLESKSPGIKSRTDLWDDVLVDDKQKSKTQYPIVKINSYYDLISCVSTISSWVSSYGMRLLYRGQRKFHNGSQYPSLIRNLYRLNPTHYENLYDDIVKLLPDYYTSLINFDDLFLNNPTIYDSLNKNLVAIEGIMQHYSINTRYIDLVDQLQTAIWFSHFKYDFERRVVNPNQDPGYLFCYGVQEKTTIGPGIKEGTTQRLVSLREVVSNYGMRPHIQQAYTLIDSRALQRGQWVRYDFNDIFDYSKFVLTAIEIPSALLQELLSEKSADNLLAAKYLFPPASEDKLLNLLWKPPSETSLQYLTQIQNAIDKYPTKVDAKELLGAVL